MGLDQVLHMKEGTGETSYAHNSILQQKVISLTKSIIEEAVTNLYCSIFPRKLAIADLGCSSGPNTFFVVFQVIKSVEKLCRELNHDESPEYQIFMNDLLGNDFNTVFNYISNFKKDLSHEMEADTSIIGPCYINGVPGSFYGRIFPNKSLHFVHSSYSLHWLSQASIENNKGNIYITRTSPANVLNAYYEQFQRDWSLFLKCRAEELVEGGCMVLTLPGRRSQDPTSKESIGYLYELLLTAINDLVLKGVIEAEQLDTFNIPNYLPSPSELKQVVLKEGSFMINRMEVCSVSIVHENDACHRDELNSSSSLPEPLFVVDALNVAKLLRAVLEPLMVNHFGQAIVDEAFWLFPKLLLDSVSGEEKPEFFNVTLYLTRQA
ncbi:hypothetical protein RIF29_28024 [Crotalaria pallida]|uniref:Uncharacterized protein n=1 Tax=Crotalaria pallida TaxID=3830 RepID=A0AAN9EQ61_CROPI